MRRAATCRSPDCGGRAANPRFHPRNQLDPRVPDPASSLHNAPGNELWVMRYDGPSEPQSGAIPASPDSVDNDCDYAYAMALDGRGNAYIAGASFDDASRYDYATVKYVQEDTPVGTNVEVVDAATGTTIIFARVLTGGNTAVAMTQSTSMSLAGLNLVPAGTLYEMSTSAVFSGTIDIAIRYEGAGLTAAQETTLKLWYYEGATNKWIDVTAYVDAANNIIRGVSPGLSFFAVTTTP